MPKVIKDIANRILKRLRVRQLTFAIQQPVKNFRMLLSNQRHGEGSA
jgi:hypothetical protein